MGYNGGYEQFLLVKRPRNLVKIPDNVTSEEAAAITDAVLTPYHAIKSAGVGPASNILIIGAGGLGGNAIQVAKAFGAKVTVLDKRIRQETKLRPLELTRFTVNYQTAFYLGHSVLVLILFRFRQHTICVKSIVSQRVLLFP